MRYLCFFLLIFFSSCSIQKWSSDRAHRYFRTHQQELSALCALSFPIKETFLQGEEVVLTDTVFQENISILCPPQQGGKTAFVTCPAQKKVVQKIFRTDTIVKENTAKISQLNHEISAYQHQLKLADFRCAKHKRMIKYLAVLFFSISFLNLIFLFFRLSAWRI